MTKKILYSIIAFAAVTIIMCIANYLLQIAFIFLDVVTRLSSSSAFVIILWIVTGVFAAIFTSGAAEAFIGKKDFTYKVTGNTVIIIAAVAIVFSIVLLVNGQFRHNPSEFTLLFSNGYIFLSFFAGAGAMAAILRNIDK